MMLQGPANKAVDVGGESVAPRTVTHESRGSDGHRITS